MNAPAAPRKQRRIISEQIDQTKPAAIIVNKAGGLTAFANAYDYPPSTVQSWLVRGFIPARTRVIAVEGGDGTGRIEMSHHAWILQRSKELRHGIKPEDFIEKLAAA